jgi:hydrogenase-4 component F
MLHLINNGLTKGVLFLSAANIHRAYGSKLTDQVRGALRRVPISAALFLAGFIAITGSPPFGPFFSEFTILRAAFAGGRFVVAALFLLMLIIVFMGMGSTVLAVVQGEPPDDRRPDKSVDETFHDSFQTVAPAIGFLALVLMLGLYLPPPLSALLHDAAAFVEGQP